MKSTSSCTNSSVGTISMIWDFSTTISDKLDCEVFRTVQIEFSVMIEKFFVLSDTETCSLLNTWNMAKMMEEGIFIFILF